ncbi:hypothetical protein [Arhodomonas sp. AD133]|uniref:RHS repeat domain-containing protein n=1 Tax=Arhodomonas sp. AD133 TaxID=3415009 RepID=UPI003EBD12B8
MNKLVLALAMGLFMFIAPALAQQGVIRDYYEEPGINPFRDTLNQNFSEHIDTFSGMLQLSFTDVFIPGNGGFDLEVQRVYKHPQDERPPYSPYGLGWTIHLGRIVVANRHSDKICSQNLADESVVDNPSLELPDGSRQLLVVADYHQPEMITRDWWSASCDGRDVIVRSPDGTEYHMTERHSDSQEYSIYATYIEDANGNSMSIDYEVNATGIIYIDDISTSDGRSVDFTYTDVGHDSIRLDTIVANQRTWDYHYEMTTETIPAYPQLTQVERPDGSSRWNYEYFGLRNEQGEAGSFAMKHLEYPWGGYIDYTYDYVHFDRQESDWTTVLATKDTGGRDISAGSWTFSYSPGWQNSIGYDITTVTSPDATRKHYHRGYSSVNDGSMWSIGLKYYEEAYDLTGNIIEQTQYTWAGFRISDEDYWHGRDTGRIDKYTATPYLEKVRHYRENVVLTTTYATPDAYAQPQQITETGNVSDAGDRVTTLTYYNDPSRWILGKVKQREVNHPKGSSNDNWTTKRAFDNAGNVLTLDKYGVKTTFTYTSDGDVATETDARNNTTTYSDYFRGIPRRENRPEGISISRTVNNTGTLDTVTDGRGHTTDYDWDALNRLESIDYPAKASVSISYSNTGSTLTRSNFREIREWDGFRRRIGVTRQDTATGESVTRTMSRDAKGRVTFRSYPGETVGDTFTYGLLGRRTSITHADGSSKTIRYPDAHEKLVTNENGWKTRYFYEYCGGLAIGEGRLSQINSFTGIGTIINRDARGKIYSVFQGQTQNDGTYRGYTRNFTYNSKGFLISASNPETGTTTYGRDAVGNMTSRQVGSNGVTETFSYDNLNRLESVSYSDDSPSVTYRYDANDNLKRLENGSAVRTYDYDANDNLISEDLTVDGRTYTVGYDINQVDFITGLTYPSGRQVSLATNALGRATQAAPYVTQVLHHPNGIPSDITYANGATNTVTLDSRQRIDTLTASGPSDTLVDHDYAYDNVGNVTEILNGLDHSRDRTMDYDGVNRMISATGSWGTETISYDATGNILNRTRGSTTQSYYYNDHRLAYRELPNDTIGYAYDAQGNITGVEGGASYQYNGAGHMVQASTPSGTIGYAYDGEGTRVQRTGSSAIKDVFYNKRGRLLGEYNPAGGFDEYIYVGSRLAARIHDDTTVVGSDK